MLSSDGVVLLCRIENGEEWIPQFLAHYRALGVGHMVFLDTGSTDRTLELLMGNDVTVYTTAIPFKTHRLWMRRVLMDLCRPDTWTLNVDIDELFDYPFSSLVRLPALCSYLDQHAMTAMRAHMLDCFAPGLLGSREGLADALLQEQYPLYDLHDVTVIDEPEYFDNMLPAYVGGIRKTIFDRGDFWLTKHPLVKTGSGVRAFEDGEHHVTGARYADVTGVLLHYKFTPSFRAYVEESVRRGQHWNDSEEYRAYKDVLKKEPRLSLQQGTSRRWKGVDALVDEGFLMMSDAYRQYALDLP